MLITDMGQIGQLPDDTFRAKIHFRDGFTRSRRVQKGGDGKSFAIYAGRSRTRGCWYHSFQRDVVGIEFNVQGTINPVVQWQKSWTRALKMLEESGLWPDLKAEIETGLDIGYGRLIQAYNIYGHNSDDVDRVEALDPRLVSVGTGGKRYINTSIVWRMSAPAKIKKMYFGKHCSEHYLQQIAEAMRNKMTFSTSAQAGYDVGFEYKPETKRAWYSEEFRGCGNGHYYLALNASHAVFYEDD